MRFYRVLVCTVCTVCTCTLKPDQSVSIYATICGHLKYEIHNVTEYGYGVRIRSTETARRSTSTYLISRRCGRNHRWFDGGHDPAQSALSYN